MGEGYGDHPNTAATDAALDLWALALRSARSICPQLGDLLQATVLGHRASKNLDDMEASHSRALAWDWCA